MLASEAVTREVMAAMEDLRSGYESGDIEALMAAVQPDADVVTIGTAADEVRVGKEQVRFQLERDLAQSESRSLRMGWMSISASGPVAWVAATVDVGVQTGGEAVGFPLRMTAVLEDRGNGWKFAQLHFSVADRNTPEGQSYPTP